MAWFSYNKDLPAVVDYDDKALPPTPGFKPPPPSIAQLAIPSPESSSPSTISQEPEPPRRRNRLKKPPPSSYSFSFIPEQFGPPSPDPPNFPYIFTPAADSMPPRPQRKLTKRRPPKDLPPTPPPPPLQRRSTFSFSLRRISTLQNSSSQSENAHTQVSDPHYLNHNVDVIRKKRGGWNSTLSLSMEMPRTRLKPTFVVGDSPRSASPVATPRPPLLRRDAATASPKRRWTLAMALTDDAISDELLVEKLEALRSRSYIDSFPTHDPPDEWLWSAYDDELDSDDWLPPPVPDKDASASMPSSPATATWQSARRALLTCRDLVRTERHYLAALQVLLDGGTRQKPPPLMCAYANALARESAGLLRRMEEDPTAGGLASALLAAEETLESALVAWCGVVGGWFVDAAPRRLSKMRTGSESEDSPTKWRIRRASGTSLSSGRPMSDTTTQSAPAVPYVASASSVHSASDKDPRPAVRDLAILPTQRVMRYVLLFRDLLEHTSTQSPARDLVVQAVDASLRIAQRCDRAQGNSAFLRRRA